MNVRTSKTSIVETCFFTLIYTSFFLPFVYFTSVWNPFQTPKAFFFLFLVECIFPFYAILLVQNPELRPSRKNIFLISFVCFLLLDTIAAVFGKDPLNSFFGNADRVDGLILWWHLPFLYAYLDVAFRLRTHAKETILNLFLGTMGVTALIGCLQAIHFIPLYSNQFNNRVASTLGNPIFFAGTIIIPFFLALDRLRSAKKISWKYLYGVITLLCFVGIIVSQTRGAFVGIILGGITFGLCLFFQSTHKKKRLFGILLTLVFITSAVFVFVGRDHVPRKSSLYRVTHFQDESASTRLVYWDYALRGFLKAPWLGVGHQNFFTVADTYYTSNAFATQTEWPDKPHNVFLEILVTGGIFTFLFYILLFALSTNLAWKLHDPKQLLSSPALIAALVAYAAQNMFTFEVVSTLYALTVLFAFMTIHPLDPIKKQFQTPPHPLLWMTACVPLLSCFLFLIPMIQQMYFVGIAHTQARSNFPSAFAALKHVADMRTIYDPFLLATEFENLLSVAITINHAPIKTIEEIHGYTASAFTHAVIQHPLRTFLLTESANASFFYAVATKTPVSQNDIDIAKQAHERSPGRIEPLLTLANIFQVNKDQETANSYAMQALQTNPTQAKILWKLALFYARANDFQTAAPLGIKALQANMFTIYTASDLDWLIFYYQSRPDVESKKLTVYLFELGCKIEPKNLLLLPELATAYAKNNQKEKAIETANLLMQKDPSTTKAATAFIQSLH
ncbi:MAG: O-antigen ligase family protein [Candidatus Uhrbacteria bacterium]|nr:O-antigen ligase family protein [Candidatus Uhrbacteria bacterium]